MQQKTELWGSLGQIPLLKDNDLRVECEQKNETAHKVQTYPGVVCLWPFVNLSSANIQTNLTFSPFETGIPSAFRAFALM